VRRERAAGVVATLAAVLALVGPLPSARADGDPASDYLLVQSTFLSPFDGHASLASQTALISMVAQAQKQGLPLKVAVIVTPYDLGSVPMLFRKPAEYASFLGQEDYYYWKDELIVVMPNGYGIYLATAHGDGVPAADQAALRALPFQPTSNGTALVLDAERAVRAVAAKHGITLGTGGGAPKKTLSTADSERFEIAGGVVVALLAAAALRFGRRLRAR
jgi:hypothetical protein